MSKRRSSKYKLDRRLGVNLWGRAKSPINRREYGPGEHGQRRRKISDFGAQLQAKQTLKGHYGEITEKQFRRVYAEAARRRGDTVQNLVGLLERRLDMAVYRMNFAPTIFAARQIVNHGHILVNGRRVTVASYRVNEGDTLEVRAKSKQHPLILETAQHPEREAPDYVEVDLDKLKGVWLRQPEFGEIPYPARMEPNLVIEYYSR